MTYALLTAPEALAQPALATRYMVELASNEVELDAYGVPVPSDYKRLDVVVTEPTFDAIEQLLQITGNLDGWGIVNHWTPEDCDCF